MGFVRAVAIVIVAAAFAGQAKAEDFWGRRLGNQPANFIFGYGSLINTASRNSTASEPITAIPVRVSAAFGFIRTWNDRSPSGFTALGLRRPEPGEGALTINGVLYPAGNDMAAFDAREEGYVRVEVPHDQIEAVSWRSLPAEGMIWVYVPKADGKEPGVGLPLPSPDYPMLESYIDVVIEGGLEYGPDFAREIVLTTQDWSSSWLNDRALARRPWVFDKNYATVDRLLAATAQHFQDRLFAEPYAARNLLAR